ncbi:GNAT family N-acetyltransferase [Alkalihalobacterium elongatum]|uniref:GNAT family N-acetyltransferase n=1 Tax=Alkalihalobacterium elongatum TaxID=2675466 RepID=UPI001C1FE56B|nr:GNAT family N-acetyltransferase [Alkalihalobacterium elongatum]
MEWKLKTFEQLTNLEVYNILKQRTNVFVVEQNCPYEEVDGYDLSSHHLFKEVAGDVVAYLRILPSQLKYKECSIGRVIVKKEYRGTGLAKEMLKQAIDFIENNLNEGEIKIQAQQYLEQFYGSFGFKTISEVYLEDEIPHIDMIYKSKEVS